jgi:hypothetical protein
MSALTDAWNSYLTDLTADGAVTATNLRAGLAPEAVAARYPPGLTFTAELREWFTLHQGASDVRWQHVSGSWNILSLRDALDVHAGNVAQQFRTAHGIADWRDSLFPFVWRDASANLFVECDPRQPQGVFYFSPWDCDAPVQVGASMADVVERWRRLLSDGEIVVEGGGLRTRSVDHLPDYIDELLA